MAYLLALNGQRQGRDLQLDRDLLHFGRSEMNDFMLEDPSVSGRHCTITRHEDYFVVRDLDSSNGTRVNDHEVKEQRVGAGDIIEMGSLLFRFMEHDVARPASPLEAPGDPFSDEEVEPPAVEQAPVEPPPLELPPEEDSSEAEPFEAYTDRAPSSVALPSGRLPVDLSRRSMNYTYLTIGSLIVFVVTAVIYLNMVMS
jgi:predicted component of type VI protein secretion system